MFATTTEKPAMALLFLSIFTRNLFDKKEVIEKILERFCGRQLLGYRRIC
jgi:hypothetical protein